MKQPSHFLIGTREGTQKNRLFVLTALSLFLVLDASHAQTSLHKQRVDEQIDKTSCASANWLSQLAESTQSDVTTKSQLRHCDEVVALSRC